MSQSDGTTPVFRDMMAMSQSDGTTHVLRDLLKISVKAGSTSSAASFRILAFISSGPEALCSSRSFNSLKGELKQFCVMPYI